MLTGGGEDAARAGIEQHLRAVLCQLAAGV